MPAAPSPTCRAVRGGARGGVPLVRGGLVCSPGQGTDPIYGEGWSKGRSSFSKGEQGEEFL